MEDEKDLNPETMPLEELKAMILAEKEKPEIKTTPVETETSEEEIKEEEPEQIVIHSEIDLKDGSGVQVFTGKGATEIEALRDLNTKLVEAQRNATKKIHDLNSKVKIIDEREAIQQRSLKIQQDFVDSHPDYVADVDNGSRITSEVQRLGYGEFTDESLEKAYQSLKASGLLKIKAEVAGGTTEEEALQPERIATVKVEATQPRSPKRSSTISTRSTSPTVVKTAMTEDELYAMPLDKLRQMANEQLANRGSE